MDSRLVVEEPWKACYSYDIIDLYHLEELIVDEADGEDLYGSFE
jgi:hypothetical protein